MIKVNATIKKDLITSKRELGSFCAQYAYEKILHSSAKQERYYRFNRKDQIKNIQISKKNPIIGNQNLKTFK